MGLSRRELIKRGLFSGIAAMFVGKTEVVVEQKEKEDRVIQEEIRKTKWLNCSGVLINPGLKPDCELKHIDNCHFAEVAMSKGTVVEYPKNTTKSIVPPWSIITSGKPAGILMRDVVDIDTTRQLFNSSCVVPLGGKVTICNLGTLIVRFKDPENAKFGQPVYYDKDGMCTTKNNHNGKKIGTCLSMADEDGYVKISVCII